PDTVTFAATGEAWGVDYRHAPGRGVRVREDPAAGTLVAAGDVADADACLRALRRWLDRAAAERLGAVLAEESARLALPYVSARFRRMRTRWGTCSRAGAITLNPLLLFRTPERARCTVVHELVHTLRHDHSPHFRAELERRFPGAAAVERAGRHDMREVPPWAVP
ncbi:MAG: M48 family metallopeptidase, partial [Actinobacteria bacterium]